MCRTETEGKSSVENVDMWKWHRCLHRTVVVALFMVGALDGLSAQERPQQKDPTLATILSVLITGGGHMYAGEALKGFGLLFGGAAAVGTGYALRNHTDCSTESTYDPFGNPYTQTICRNKSSDLPLKVGLATAAACWLYGVFDAGDAARRTNRKNGYAASDRVAPYVARGSGRTNLYGVQLSVR